MNTKLKKAIQYLVSIGFSVVLLWYVYREQSISEIIETLEKTHYQWIFISIFAAIISHISRSFRWKLMLEPGGHKVPTFRVFLAVMTGYIANLVFPRMGEVARCGALHKTDKVPTQYAFGSVITERAFDFIIMLSIMVITVFIEFDKIGELIFGQFEGFIPFLQSKMYLLGGIAIVGLAGMGFVVLRWKKLIQIPLFNKVFNLLSGIKDGVIGIFRLSPKAQAAFIFHTAVIWAMYFIMSYVMFFALDETANLPLSAALSAFVMGGVGMTIPTPGGTGSYHLLVTATLVAYGLAEKSASTYALVMHSTQTIMVVVVGGFSLIMISLLSKKTKLEA
ncbi:lysylphosphatidylglycerol synthase transmembrane domain-containing protein [Sediminitomix flava]|uniref:Lysylphosphatidylglycerol synthase-like protein n=1 Tax=Sediminitomix flava TaxID=379075 RepID=A0A315ZB55_SEDFL|nr:lysylphosphatidylglycerol synthase transmembrane domain-containing protein [Sediminitomix flava]PWJ42048.1 hypothetical protein BC781_103298 [Sediminitomix flava]